MSTFIYYPWADFSSILYRVLPARRQKKILLIYLFYIHNYFLFSVSILKKYSTISKMCLPNFCLYLKASMIYFATTFEKKMS